MLTLTRKPKESVVINEGRESVIVTVKAIEPGKVRLSFQARRHVPIDRLEVRLDKMAKEQAEEPQVSQSQEPQIAQIAQRGQDQNRSAKSEKSADDDHPPQVEESHKPQIAQRGQNENPSAESAKSADDGPKPTCERAYNTTWPVSSTGEVCSPLVSELVRLMEAGWSVESIAAAMPNNLSRAAEIAAARQNSRRSLQTSDC